MSRGSRPETLLERIARVLAVAEIVLGHFLGLVDVIVLPERFRQDHVGVADVIEMGRR